MPPTWALGAVVALLILLAIWQRRIDRKTRERKVEQIREARAIGADRPVGLHPIVQPLACIGCGSCVRACPEEGVLELIDSVAHVVRASRCIGHALCEAACPVGAIRVGLGPLARSPDLPVLDEDLQTTVPGIYIAGELGGIGLIRNAISQGVRAVNSIGEVLRESEGEEGLLDLLIVGAGPAGLAAALRAKELGLRYLAIDQHDIGGTVRKYPRRKLVLTQPVELPLAGSLRCREYLKEELVELFEGIVRRHGLAVRPGVRLTGASRGDRGFLAETSDGTIEARKIVLALGRRGTPRRLGVPGEETERVLYQLVDAAGFTDSRLLVVGGGDSAVEASVALAEQPGNEVILSYRGEALFRIKPRNEARFREFAERGRVRPIFRSQVEVIGDREVRLRTAEGAVELRSDFVFVFAGGEPPYPLLRKMGVGFPEAVH